MSSLAPLLQAFFTDRLMSQRRASPHTIAAYRDTFRLLLGYACAQTGKAPSALAISDLDAGCITGFLTHLQQVRGNSVRTRNARLAAIHSLFGYAALRHPEHAAVIQRVLAIPTARIERNLVSYLDHAEADALLAACDKTTRTGRRDHAMFALAIQTGLRVSELTCLRVADIHLGTGAHVHCIGKGRKERRTPLLPTSVTLMRAWIDENNAIPTDPLFPTTTGRPLSRDAVERRLHLATTRAQAACPSLMTKQITAHTLRHTAAMRLLHAGVDVTVIALWLGHEQITTTNIYLHADMTIKQNAIAKIIPHDAAPGRYQPPDPVLAFLANL
jgi:site-specific recombinase XerD